mgnify:CR=1 FL=1
MKEIKCKYFDYENKQYINEGYEEYFFTDWECEIDLDLGEYESIDNVNDLAENLEEWDDETLLKAACEIWNISEVIDNSPYDYNLYSDIQDDYDLGYYWIEESGCYRLEGILSNYFDYESFGRDIRIESNGGFTSYGWIEYVG